VRSPCLEDSPWHRGAPTAPRMGLPSALVHTAVSVCCMVHGELGLFSFLCLAPLDLRQDAPLLIGAWGVGAASGGRHLLVGLSPRARESPFCLCLDKTLGTPLASAQGLEPLRGSWGTPPLLVALELCAQPPRTRLAAWCSQEPREPCGRGLGDPRGVAILHGAPTLTISAPDSEGQHRECGPQPWMDASLRRVLGLRLLGAVCPSHSAPLRPGSDFGPRTACSGFLGYLHVQD